MGSGTPPHPPYPTYLLLDAPQVPDPAPFQPWLSARHEVPKDELYLSAISRLAQMAAGEDGELAGIVAAAIAADPAAADQVRAGNGKAIGALVGAVMRETKGRADGGEVNRLLREQLGL